MFFLSDGNNAEFGYRKAITSAFRDLSNRGTTGRTLGQVGNKFGRKISNATRGKIAAIGRGVKKLRNEFASTPKVPTGAATLSLKQQNRASRNIKKAGGVKTTIGGQKTFGNDKTLM
jgi:phage-related protein